MSFNRDDLEKSRVAQWWNETISNTFQDSFDFYEASPALDNDVLNMDEERNLFAKVVAKFNLPNDIDYDFYKELLPFTQIASQHENADCSVGLQNESARYYAATLAIYFDDVKHVINSLKDYESENPNKQTIMDDACMYGILSASNAVLESALKGNRWETIKWLVKHGADVNARLGNDHQTLLHCAARKRPLETLQWLVAKGADVQAVDSNGARVQHHAARGGIVAVMEWLDEQGVDMAVKNAHDSTLLHYALILNKFDMIKWLIEKYNLDVNAANKPNLDTPLHLAAANGQLEIVQYLIDHAADLNAKDKAGHTPLQRAARSYRWDVVQCLFPKQNMPNAKDIDGQTILHYAARTATSEIIKFLVSNGADVNEKNNLGETALHIAVGASRWKEATTLIKDCDAQVDCKDEKGRMPLVYCRPGFFGNAPDAFIELLQQTIVEKNNAEPKMASTFNLNKRNGGN